MTKLQKRHIIRNIKNNSFRNHSLEDIDFIDVFHQGQRQDSFLFLYNILWKAGKHFVVPLTVVCVLAYALTNWLKLEVLVAVLLLLALWFFGTAITLHQLLKGGIK